METSVPTVFSRAAVVAKWRRSAVRAGARDGGRFLIDAIEEDILERLAFMRFEPQRVLAVGAGKGQLFPALSAPDAAIRSEPLGAIDEEFPLDVGGYDLIVHLLGLGMVNDLPGALVHFRTALAPGGLFLASFPGSGSLPVLRGIIARADGERGVPRMHPLVGSREGAALLQRAGFTRQVVDSYTLDVRYSSLETLVEDLRDHGLTRSLATPSPPLSRSGLLRAREAFDTLRDEDGKVAEQYEILTLTGWKT
ncbi:MAG: methyltransferase domain-containing protein [Qipengyuania sp.]